MKLGFRAYCGYLHVCVKNGQMAIGPNVRTLCSKIGQYIGFRLLSWTFSTGFTGNLISLLELLFYMCKRLGGGGFPNKSKFGFSTTFFLDSHQSCFICSMKLLSEMFTTWTPKAQFLGPKIGKKIPIFSHFLRKFPFGSHQYCFTCSF